MIERDTLTVHENWLVSFTEHKEDCSQFMPKIFYDVEVLPRPGSESPNFWFKVKNLIIIGR